MGAKKAVGREKPDMTGQQLRMLAGMRILTNPGKGAATVSSQQ